MSNKLPLVETRVQFRGEARVQFLACSVEIRDMLQAGYTVVHIWKKFHGDGKVTMSYRRFAHYARSLHDKKTDNAAKAMSISEKHSREQKKSTQLAPKNKIISAPERKNINEIQVHEQNWM